MEKVKSCLGKQSLRALQAVRAIAFLGIFTSHCKMSSLGAWGTSVFIILSGFLLMYQNYDKCLDTSFCSCVKFSATKIKKLYLLHILMTLAAFVLSLYSLMKNFEVKQVFVCLGQLLLNVALLQAWVPADFVYFSLNAVAWYLSLCTFLYAMFPVLLRIIKKIHSTKKLVFFAVSIYIVQNLIGYAFSHVEVQISWIDNIQKWITYICPIFRMGDFTLGACAGYCFASKKTRNETLYNVKLASVVEIFFILLMCFAHFLYKNYVGLGSYEWFRYNMIYSPASLGYIYMFAVNKGIISKTLTNKPLLYIADISAYAFLIHQIVIRFSKIIFIFISGNNYEGWGGTVIVLGLTIVCCELYKKVTNLFNRHVERNNI